MREKTVFMKHYIALFLLFYISDALILFPLKSSDKYFFFGIIAAAVAGFLIFFVSLLLSDKIISQNGKPLYKVIKPLVLVAVAVYALFCAADTFSLFTDFAAKIMLGGNGKIISVVLFGAVCLFFATRRQEDILKFCLLAAVFTVAVTVFFVLCNIGKYDMTNLSISIPKTADKIVYSMLPYLKIAVMPSILLAVYQKTVFLRIHKRYAALSYIISNIFLMVCIVFSVAIFSLYFAAGLEYPFADAVSTISVGRLFTRMDGLSYFIYFACCLVRVSVCIFIAISSLKKTGLQRSKIAGRFSTFVK